MTRPEAHGPGWHGAAKEVFISRFFPVAIRFFFGHIGAARGIGCRWHQAGVAQG